MKNTSCVLILSCDKYADLWYPFFEILWKNWPDCPITVYLGSNTISYKDRRVKTILSGKDENWSSSYKKILNQIPEKYIFVWVEDGFVIRKVNTNKVVMIFDFMERNNANHIHFRPLPKPDNLIDINFGAYHKCTPYRVNLVGFWRKKYLLKLLLDGENGWDFEIMGSYRSSYDEGFYCLNYILFDYIHAIEKGKWLPEASNYCKAYGYKIDKNNREFITRLMIIKSKLKSIYFDFMMKTNSRFRVKTMDLLRKLLVSY